MNGLFPALTAYTAWGVGDTIGAVISRRLSSWSLTFWGFLIRLSLYTCMIPWFTGDLKNLTPYIALVAILVGFSSAIGYLTFYKSTQLMNPTLAGAIAGSWGASSLLYSLIFLHDTPTHLQIVAILLIFTGLAIGIINTSKNAENSKKGIMFAVLTMMLWGICGSFIQIPIQTIGWFWSTYALVIPFLFIAFYQFVIKRNIPQNPVRTGSVWILGLYALLTVIAECSYNFGITSGNVSLVAPIAGSNSSLYAVLSILLFKEKLTTLQKLSVGITIAGIVLLSFVSV